MFVSVLATPKNALMRVGERFRLQPGMPLRIGTAREARIRLHGNALLIEVNFDGQRAVISGGAEPGRLVTVPEGELRDGSLLFIDSTLVLRLHEQLLRPPARNLELERVLANAPDDEQTWSVYGDFLEENGDPLASWLRSTQTPEEELLQLGALALSAQHLAIQWTRHRVARSVMISPDAPELPWLIEQLPRVPLMRLLHDVRVDWLTGGMAHDEEAAELISSLRGLHHLQSVKLGIITQQQSWPLTDAAWRELDVPGDWVWRIPSGARASLSLHRNTSAIGVDGNVVLNPLRTDVGTAPGCLVRLMGDAPRVACSIRRMPEGEWVVSSEVHALRVNGVPVMRSVLRPNDLIEPVSGLQLRFNWPA